MAKNIKERIEGDLKEALLNRQTVRVTTLRLLKNAILNEEINTGKRETGLSDEEVIICLQRESKKRNEAATMYRDNNQPDKAQEEEKEKKIIEEYLPAQMSEEELVSLVDAVLKDFDKPTQADMGQIIGKVRQKAGGSAQGGDIARLVKDRLQ